MRQGTRWPKFYLRPQVVAPGTHAKISAIMWGTCATRDALEEQDHLPAPAYGPGTGDKRPISATSTRLGTGDGRIDLNGTVNKLAGSGHLGIVFLKTIKKESKDFKSN